MKYIFLYLAAAILLCACSTTFLGSQAGAPDNTTRLFAESRRSGRMYEWWLSASRAKALPQWRPDSGQQPPLSLRRAINIARKGGGQGEKLESVAILSIPGAEYAAPFNTVFYYKFTFRVDPFDRRSCVVLMDGTILTPTEYSTLTPSNSEQD